MSGRLTNMKLLQEAIRETMDLTQLLEPLNNLILEYAYHGDRTNPDEVNVVRRLTRMLVCSIGLGCGFEATRQSVARPSCSSMRSICIFAAVTTESDGRGLSLSE
jgi:hypothetical protein